MKNRTLIGIICMILAVSLTFIVSPVVSKLTTDTVEVPRLSSQVGQGSKITSGSIEKVSVQMSLQISCTVKWQSILFLQNILAKMKLKKSMVRHVPN